jgi:hypothetical protein
MAEARSARASHRRGVPRGAGVLVGLVALAQGATSLGGCESGPSDTPPAADASAPEAAVIDASPRRDAAREAGPTGSTLRFEDWARWDDYSPNCELRIPANKEQFPPPLVWEPTPAYGSTGIRGKRIRIDWAPAPSGDWMRDKNDGLVMPDGTVLLQIGEARESGYLHVIADLQGEIRSAIYAPLKKCALDSRPSNGSHYAYGMYEYVGGVESVTHGAIGGVIGAPHPSAVAKYERSRGVTAAEQGVVEGEGAFLSVVIHPWDGVSPSTKVFGGLSVIGLRAYQDIFFFSVSTTDIGAMKVYTPEYGLKDLLTYPGDRTRGAANLNTDGKVWVWLEGSERPPGELLFPKVALMTSPFVRDVSKIVPRAVRTDLTGNGMGTASLVTACGRVARYAARNFPDGHVDMGFEIFNLGDGTGWFLPQSIPGVGSFSMLMALTCDEIVLMSEQIVPNEERRNTVVRLELSSLGAFRLN